MHDQQPMDFTGSIHISGHILEVLDWAGGAAGGRGPGQTWGDKREKSKDAEKEGGGVRT